MQTVKIGDQEYQMALTVSAAIELMRRYGDIKGAILKLQSTELSEELEETISIAGVLIRGGCDHAKLHGEDAAPPPDYGDIVCMVFPSDIPALRAASLAAITAGLKREIEASGDKKKDTKRSR